MFYGLAALHRGQESFRRTIFVSPCALGLASTDGEVQFCTCNHGFNQFTRLFRLFLRGQVTRHGFTLIGAPRRICFCPKFLLLLQCFSNPRFLPFLSDRAPVPLHLFRLYLYGSSMPVRVMISRFQQMPRRFGMHVIANQLPGILRGTNPSSDGRKPPIPLLGGGSSSSLFEVVKAFHPSRESIPYLAIVAFFFVLIP